ncbi:ribosome recycling factor [Oscillatoria laete-virens NRMC-F 0139]|nr:ribosome recycling factor [Oscillatoria laete-virens]MDL5052995.1 ribosome recycling factor [Oscillatoria laete-virens NRMC-F 0139]
MMTLDDVLLETDDKMQKCTESVEREMASIRTGKANPGLVENLHVEAYEGVQSKLREVASISAPEPRMILVQPWDVSIIKAIESAIQKANIGLSPVTDGKIIRIPIPELSQERRAEMVKVVRKMAEDGRVAVRAVRRNGIEDLKKLQKDGKITEDDLKDGEKEIQSYTDKYVKHIDGQLEKKESDLLKV